MKPETLQFGCQIAAALFSVLAILSGLGAHYYGTQKQTVPGATSAEVKGIVKDELTAFYSNPPLIDRTENEKYSGISINSVLRAHKINAPRRKYLLDLDYGNNGRFSVYFSPQNVFTVLYTDATGEPYSLRAPAGPTGVPFDRFFYLNCELGIRANSSFLRVTVDGRTIGTVDIPTAIATGFKWGPGGTLGADTKGANGAAFDQVEFFAYNATLTTSEIGALLQYAASKKRTGYLEFDGNKWSKVDPENNLRQDNPSLQPVYRTF